METERRPIPLLLRPVRLYENRKRTRFVAGPRGYEAYPLTSVGGGNGTAWNEGETTGTNKGESAANLGGKLRSLTLITLPGFSLSERALIKKHIQGEIAQGCFPGKAAGKPRSASDCQ